MHTCTPLFASLVVAVAGCASVPHATEKVAAGAWHFPIEGQLTSITVSDLAAVVRAVPQSPIYRLRVVNRNTVEADTSPLRDGFSYSFTPVKRVHGQWQPTERVIITP